VSRHTIACPACGTEHIFEGTLSFREECERCAADLHVCLTCAFHDRYVENECRETEADYVATKDRRNLCEYYKPKVPSGEAHDEVAAAKAKLAVLFGGPKPPASEPGTSKEDEAKRRLEELFKKR
jgi:hypothetical protein